MSGRGRIWCLLQRCRCINVICNAKSRWLNRICPRRCRRTRGSRAQHLPHVDGASSSIQDWSRRQVFVFQPLDLDQKLGPLIFARFLVLACSVNACLFNMAGLIPSDWAAAGWRASSSPVGCMASKGQVVILRGVRSGHITGGSLSRNTHPRSANPRFQGLSCVPLKSPLRPVAILRPSGLVDRAMGGRRQHQQVCWNPLVLPKMGAELPTLAVSSAAARGPSIKKPRPGLGSRSGAKRTRTADPLHAMQVLYQLSYGPIDMVSGLTT
jgi:hypothetical protein